MRKFFRYTVVLFSLVGCDERANCNKYPIGSRVQSVGGGPIMVVKGCLNHDEFESTAIHTTWQDSVGMLQEGFFEEKLLMRKNSLLYFGNN